MDTTPVREHTALDEVDATDSPTTPLVSVRDLHKTFPVRGGAKALGGRTVQAVAGVSFDIDRGETLGLVGESGCGKSTLGRTLLRLEEPTGGTVHFDGHDITTLKSAKLRALRRKMQMIYQDPYSSLNPRMTAAQIIGEALVAHGVGSRHERFRRVAELLEIVGLGVRAGKKYPHEFSGGQRQRIGIARALVLRPSFVVCDEAVSALDVSIQAQVLNLLTVLREEMGLTYLFISHNLGVVRHIADRVAVMYLGSIVELAPVLDFFASPRHPYSLALLSAIPAPEPDIEHDRERIILRGDLPTPSNPPSGCRFHTRCPFAQPVCATSAPPLESGGEGHLIACHFWRDIQATEGQLR